MKIKEVNGEHILFDNGMDITCDHDQDCCECNYADFEQIDDIAMLTDFDEVLSFEAVEQSGFRFGNQHGKMFFIPCYSDQNGYYSNDVDIYFNGQRVLNLECEERND